MQLFHHSDGPWRNRKFIFQFQQFFLQFELFQFVLFIFQLRQSSFIVKQFFFRRASGRQGNLLQMRFLH
ncbi:hypothetical protein HMPREF3038_01613 [Akkermansia sp. KLE1797]|nr:hypothetical protein HMPREF3038_01613 [Akkermansia sp. KLE1797]KXU54104.1 hypothetical protein HMPREF3039_01769 [Akkermansia sp. KLE1798]KZA05590.1 hypothetical protein HMPREF1326_00765 [Akkermansia sp. KLE1605]